MSDRDYVKMGKLISLPDSSIEKRKMNNDAWKSQVFFHLLYFYRNHIPSKIKEIIDIESKKPQMRIEDEIATFIRNSLKTNRSFSYQGFIVVGGVNNDEKAKGLYDISIYHSDWKDEDEKNIELHFECKILNSKSAQINKYVFYDTGKSVFDGGVYRFFNGKYSQNQDFGGMIGFVLNGELLKIKEKLLTKIKEKFDISPEGDFIVSIDKSILNNDFTFDTIHKRKGSKFLISHILFDFTYD